MTQAEQDSYNWAIGDGQASITVSRELSESDYGNGGKAFVSITLTCGQDKAHIDYAFDIAKNLVEAKVWEAHASLKQQLISRGMLKG